MVARKVGRKTGKGKGPAVEQTAPPVVTPAKLWIDAPASRDAEEDTGPWYSDLQPFSVLEEDGAIKRPAGVSWSWTAPKSLPGERLKSPKEMEPPAIVGHDSIWRDAKDSTKLAVQKKVDSNYGGGHGGGLLKKTKTAPCTGAGTASKKKQARAEDEEANTDDDDGDSDSDGDTNGNAGDSDNNDDGGDVGGSRNAKAPAPAPAETGGAKNEKGGVGSKSRRQARQAKLAALAAAAQQTAYQVSN